MYLSGMQLGFTSEEVGRMTLPRLQMFIEAHNDLMAGDDDDATQGDIDALLA